MPGTFTNEAPTPTSVTKTITLNGEGGQTDMLFTIAGIVKVVSIRGLCTEAANSTTLSGAFWEIFSTGSNVSITDNTGTDLSGIAVGGFINKIAGSGTVLNFNPRTTSPAVVEGAGEGNVDFPCILAATATGTTYIRFGFTGDASTDVDMEFTIEYYPITSDGAVVAA